MKRDGPVIKNGDDVRYNAAMKVDLSHPRMGGAPIGEVITLVLRTMQLSNGDDLRGFAIDAYYALEEEKDVVAEAVVAISDEPRSILNGRILLKDSVATIQSVSDVFLRTWPKIAYSDFQAASIERFIEGTVFRFVTAVPRSSLCVTGTFIASSPNHGRLVANLNSDYASLVKSIRAMPGGLPAWALW